MRLEQLLAAAAELVQQIDSANHSVPGPLPPPTTPSNLLKQLPSAQPIGALIRSLYSIAAPRNHLSVVLSSIQKENLLRATEAHHSHWRAPVLVCTSQLGLVVFDSVGPSLPTLQVPLKDEMSHMGHIGQWC